MANLENFDVKACACNAPPPFDTVYTPDLKVAIMRTRGVMTRKQAARYDKYRRRFELSALPFHLEWSETEVGQGYDDSVVEVTNIE